METRQSIDANAPDDRFALLDAAMEKYSRASSSLIEVLHVAQTLFGYLRTDVLEFVAEGLDLPPSKVQGVATFYHLFATRPQGRHKCVVCLGTTCYVKSAESIVAALESELNIATENTTADGEWSLRVARCVGCCGHAPLLVVDGSIVGPTSSEDAVRVIRSTVPMPVGGDPP